MYQWASRGVKCEGGEGHLCKALGLGAAVGAPDDEPVGLGVLPVGAQLAQHAIDLQAQLPRRADDNHARPISAGELHLGEQLDGRDLDTTELHR